MATINYNTYLYHYGVKGMKWGIRHDPERVGRSRGSAKSKKNKKGLTKATKIFLGAAAVTGMGAAAVYFGGRYMQNGRLAADNILKAGTTLKQVTMHPENVKNGETVYIASRTKDALNYRVKWGKETELVGDIFNPQFKETFKDTVETKVTKDIKVAGLKTGEKVFNDLYKTDKEFAKKADDIFDQYSRALGNNNKWEVFNTIAPLRNPKNPKEMTPGYKEFENALRKRGYHGFADVNDRKNSGYNTQAHILFDYKDKIGDTKVRQLNQKDIDFAKKRLARYKVLDDTLTTKNLAYTSTGSAATAGLIEGGARTSQKNKKKKK